MRKFAVLALVLALTGCSVQEPAPIITPVDLKYCALSDAAGFDDDGLNRSVYAALQQLKVQTGASVMAIEVSDKLTPAAGIQKLVDAECNGVITAGEDLAKATLAAARQNASVKFVSVGDIVNTEGSASNFTALTFNIYQAAFAAGYLAAAEATTTSNVAVLDLIKNVETAKSIKSFTAGIARYNTINRSRIKLNRVAAITGVADDVVFVLAGSSTELNNDTLVESVKIIGYGRDWYTDARNSVIKKNILTSVVRVGVVDKTVSAMTTEAVSQNFDLSSGQVGLVAENDSAFPRGFASALDQIIQDLNDGKVKVG